MAEKWKLEVRECHQTLEFEFDKLEDLKKFLQTAARTSITREDFQKKFEPISFEINYMNLSFIDEIDEALEKEDE